jgi:hypothetical protein
VNNSGAAVRFKRSMVANNGLMRVFWPLDAPRTESSGTIVGWRNSDLDFFVVAILEDVEVSHRQTTAEVEVNELSSRLEMLRMRCVSESYSEMRHIR